MRGFKLFIVTICIISGLYASDAFCVSNDTTASNFSNKQNKDVILNIPTQEFFSEYYHKCIGMEYRNSNNSFYKEISVKRLLIEKYPVLKHFIDVIKPSEYDSESNLQILYEIRQSEMKLNCDNNIDSNDRNILSYIFKSIQLFHRYASLMNSEVYPRSIGMLHNQLNQMQ